MSSTGRAGGFSRRTAPSSPKSKHGRRKSSQQRLDRRHLGHRAAPVVEHLDHVVAALADAELQHAGLTEPEIDLARARLRGAVVHEAAPDEVPAAAHARSIAAVTR